MIAVAYARYSTDRQTENSIEFQFDRIKQYCEFHRIPLVGYYKDEAQSGMHTENRNDLKALLADASQGKFDTVVIYDQSRLSRNVVDWFELREELYKHNITLISATQDLKPPYDPEGFLAEGVTAIMNHHFVLQTRQKTIAGQTNKAKKGLFLGGVAPLGYDIVEQEYVINPVEAQAVKLIFNMYAQGHSYGQIMEALKEKHLNIGKRGKPIGKTALHEILKNVRYIGTYFWNSQQVKRLGAWTGGIPNPNAVYIANRIPAIIDIDTWERVQKRMCDQKRNPSSGNRQYLLTGILKCAKCGSAFVGHTSINKKGYEYQYYACANKTRTRECNCRNIAANDIDPFIIYLLRDQLLNNDIIEQAADAIIAEAEKYMIDVARIKADLKELETEEQRIANAVCNGAPWEILAPKAEAIKTKKAALSAKLKTARADKIDRDIVIETLKKDIEAFVPNASVASKSEIIKKYIKEIRLDDDTIEIVSCQVLPMNGCGRGT